MVLSVVNVKNVTKFYVNKSSGGTSARLNKTANPSQLDGQSFIKYSYVLFFIAS